MSLTKNDFQEIGKIIDQKLDQKLDQKFDDNLKPIQNQINNLDKKIDQKLQPIHQKIDRMNNKLDTTIKFFDTITSKHHKRIKRVEEHLDLKPIPEFV
jgi:hypothetical protein